MIYRKLLFYYSIIIASILFVWIILFLPRPGSVIPLVLFLPIVIHFWLGVVWPNKMSALAKGDPQNEITRGQIFGFSMTVMVSIIVATISILLYSFAYERYSPIITSFQEQKSDKEELKLIITKVNSLEEQNSESNKKIDRMYDELLFGGDTEITPEKISEVLSKDTIASSEGILKVITGVSAYDDKNPKSKVVGKAQVNEIYTFTQKVTGWYLISLPDFTEGWIQSEYAQEL